MSKLAERVGDDPVHASADYHQWPSIRERFVEARIAGYAQRAVLESKMLSQLSK
jgi:hypothetical protein